MVQFNFSYDPNISLEQRVGFELAAMIWSSYLTDDVTVNLHIASSDHLGENGSAVGGAIPLLQEQNYGVYQEYLAADATSDADGQALASLQEGNTTDFLVNGEIVDGNTDMLLTSAQAKALGMHEAITLENGGTWDRNLVDANALDGYILVSNAFDWNYDYTRSGEAPEGTLDFMSMALHEIGHQLGFVSSLDGTLDLSTLHSGETQVADFTALDLFRTSVNSADINNPDGAVGDLSLGQNSYFSIDGGATNLGDFADGVDYQASHWKRLQVAMGIMDPTLAYTERLTLSQLDLQAIDVLGWDINTQTLETGLDIDALLVLAENKVEASLGLSDTALNESRGGGQHGDMYSLGYNQWWQIFEQHVMDLGYSQWWQIFELGYDQWQQQEDGLLEVGYSQWWQSFEDTIADLGYSQWWQSFESDMMDLGYSQWWQLLEVGYSQWWQKLETYFSTVEKQEWVDDTSKLTRVLEKGYSQTGVVRGGSEDDIIGGSNERDVIRGGLGDDLIDGKAGNDTIWGDDGNDVIYGHDGYDDLRGGDGNDVLSGEQQNDQLYGEDGADIVSGGEGDDIVSGGAGRDELHGGAGKDILQGGEDEDVLSGGSDYDLLMGAAGRDSLQGDSGHDVLYGDESLAANQSELTQLRRDFLKDLWQQERNLRHVNASTVTQDNLGNDVAGSSTTTSTPSDANGLIRIEAEAMTLSNGYVIENQNIRNNGSTGARALTTFDGEAGYYTVAVRYFDESDGQSTLTAKIGGQTIDSWQFTNDDNQHASRVISTQIYLSPGDTIELIGDNNAGESTRVDYIDLIPIDSLLENSVGGSSPSNLGENLFENGDFSSGLSGWNVSLGSAQTVADGAYEGQSLRFDQYSTVYQWVDIFGGQTYDFSAVAKSTAEHWSGLGIQFYDANWQLLSEQEFEVTTADWATYQNSFVTSENARYASFWAATSEHSGHLLLDNLVFQEQLAVPDDMTTAETESLDRYQTRPWDDGLVAHWSFDEATSNRTQDSLNELTARLENMESTDLVRGMVGNAISFDGINERAVVDGGTSLQLGQDNTDFSVAFWIKLEEDATGDWRLVTEKGENWENRTFAMWLHDDDNRLHYRISTTADPNEGGDSQSELAVNQWTHVSYVKSGSQLSLYLDGQLDSSVTLQGEVNSNDDPLKIGSDSLDASIDELKIYDRALTTEDVKSLSLYNADVLEGGQGQDTLYGDEGNDRLYGESENTFELPATAAPSGVFDGTNVQVYEHQDSMLLNQGTVSFSFSTDNTSSRQGLFSKDSAGYDDGGHFTIWVVNDRLELRLQSALSADFVLSSDPIEAGQVHDVAVTFGDRGLEMWVNGSLTATHGYRGGIGNNSGGSGNREPIVLGASQMHTGDLVADNLSDYFTGTIQNVRLFDRQLDSTTIAQLPTAAPDNTVFEAFTASQDASNNDVLVGGKGHDTVYGNIGDDILYGDDAVFLTNGIQHNGSLYLLTQSGTWQDAQAQAEIWGGNLVTINDEEEENWLQQTFGTDKQLWIGINDQKVEGQFEWSSGEEVTYTNWAPGEPNNGGGTQDYGVINYGGANQWDDQYPTTHLQGIIEIKLPEESGNDVMVGGIGNDVLYGELGDDILDGSNAQARGAFERDVLVGGDGADRFILGNANHAYYMANANFDYALIKDFNATEDQIQLHGSTSNYSQQQQGDDTYLYYQAGTAELVAVLENTNNVNLDRGFVFV